MTDELMQAVIDALRDTAAKTLETKTIKQMAYSPQDMAYNYNKGPGEVDVEVEAYSKDWLAGRLLGMADMIEAMNE
jgi:hypothetical protein